MEQAPIRRETARQSRTLTRLAYIFMGLFAVAVCLGAAYSSWRERVTLLDTQIQGAQASALVMEEEITLTLKLLENTLRALAEGTELSPTTMSPGTMDGLLSRLVRNQPMLRSLSVMNDRNEVYASSNPANRGTRLGLSDFLPTENPKFSAGTLRMGTAWAGRDLVDGRALSGNETLPTDRPFFVPAVLHLGAEAQGLSFVAAINPDHFLNRFNRQTVHPFQERFRWVRLDGKTLAHSGELPQGTTFGPQALLDRILKEEIGHTNAETLSAFRTSGLYPFFVTVDIPRDLALATWQESTIGMAAVVLLALGVVLWVTLMLLKKIGQEEAQLNAERVRLQAVYNVLPVGISITDPGGHIIDCNPASERLLGISKAEHLVSDLVTKDWAIYREDGSPMPSEEFASVRALQEQRAVHDCVMRVSKPGGDVWLSVSALPVAHEQYGVVIAYSDITEQKSQAQALLAAKQQAEAASRYKSQFLANMSHEIRTPMNAILGMLKLLHHTPLQSRQLDYVEKTESAARSLLSLINDILDFSKVEAGKLTLDPQPFELDQMLSDLAIIYSANLQNKPLEILLDIDPAVPSRLIGDTMRLQQILINLVGNAIKFTPSGEVVLSVNVLEQRPNHIRLGFEVRDTGIGIAPENQQKIFSGFTQAEASTTRRFGGTGLGLAICRRLVELMGGDLQLHSALGQGTRFAFSLPFYTPPNTRPHADSALCKVLLLENHPEARALIERLLRQSGHTVYCTDSEKQAQEWMVQHHDRGQPFEVVLLGGLPGRVAPWSVVTELRRIQAQRTAPEAKHERIALCVTAAGREAALQQPDNLQAMVDGYLLKPVTQQPLADLIQQILTHTKDAAVLATQNATQNLAGLRVLVVEDNAINQQVAEELLIAQGASVDLADNGERGVAAVVAAARDQRPYDAVLMDMQMPVMDGLTATAAIRRGLGLTQLPIIAMTANALASDRQSCLDAGMNDHIGKPFELENLVDKLLQWTRPEQPRSARKILSRPTVPVSAPPATNRHTAPVWFNSEAALQRLGGNQTLLERLVQRFCEDLPTLLEQCSPAHRLSDPGALGKLLHTIKGTASTLGADALASASSQAENAIRAGELPDLSELHTSAQATLAAMKALITGTGSLEVPDQATIAFAETSTHLSAEHRNDLTELLTLLNGNDMEVFKVIERLQSLPQGLRNSRRWQTLVQAIDALDFESAAHNCESLLAGLAEDA